MGTEIIFIALLMLLLFGGKRMPEVLRELGKLSRGLQQARRELVDAVNREADAAVRPVTPPNVGEGNPPPADPPVPSAFGVADAAADKGGVPPEYAAFATLPPETGEGAAASAPTAEVPVADPAAAVPDAAGAASDAPRRDAGNQGVLGERGAE